MANAFVFGSKRFSFNKTDSTFSAEASELGINPGSLNSFYIRSARTNCTKLFLRSGVTRDNDDDITSWTYISPGQGLTTVIFND